MGLLLILIVGTGSSIMLVPVLASGASLLWGTAGQGIFRRRGCRFGADNAASSRAEGAPRVRSQKALLFQKHGFGAHILVFERGARMRFGLASDKRQGSAARWRARPPQTDGGDPFPYYISALHREIEAGNKQPLAGGKFKIFLSLLRQHHDLPACVAATTEDMHGYDAT